MKNSIFTLSVLLLGFSLLNSCKEKEELPKPFKEAAVKTLSVTQENDTTFLLKGTITYGSEDKVTSYGISIRELTQHESETKFIYLGEPTQEGEFEYRIHPELTLKKYIVAAFIKLNSSKIVPGEPLTFFSLPSIKGYTPSVVSDMDYIEVEGDFSKIDFNSIRLTGYTRPDSISPLVRKDPTVIEYSPTKIKVVAPILLGTDPSKPFFTQKIMPYEIRLENLYDSLSISLGNIEYKYDFVIDPDLNKGKPGDTFYVYTFYSRTTPSPDELTYDFAGIKIKPISVMKGSGLSTVGWISGYKLGFKIPNSLPPGKVKLQITNAFGEDFRIRKPGDDEFEVL